MPAPATLPVAPAGPAALASVAASAALPPALEQRVQKLAAQLRCLVCQNQTIADSNADLAVDLKRQVREMLARGATDREIIDFMTARYGDFVLYRPPVKSTTAFLWFGPGVLLVGAVGVFLFILRRRARLPADRFEPDPLPDPLPDALPGGEAGGSMPGRAQDPGR
ncbi:MAG: cytochrome c-type biogenesis protein CcmH [Rubrivivax sp.]